ncbi:hypothetical protein G9A89_017624 [Geosiphon pyriformis]|nr:hypothetical protein G9A89_017624 [Geosiphon pyriformis]
MGGEGKARVWVIISKTIISFGTPEYKFDAITNPTTTRFWDVVSYPHAEYAFVFQVLFHRWQERASKFSAKLKLFESENILTENLNEYTFTGFGIGAAFAVFAALEYKRNHMKSSINLITFGQPRIGDELFVIYTQRMLDKVWRVTHGDDWLPNFPIHGFDRERKIPSGLKSKSPRIIYKHFQKEFWIESSCDCSNSNVYLCYHTATLNEHEDCNARNHLHNVLYPGNSWEDAIKSYRKFHPDDEHFGSYFGYTMFQNCPQL